MIFPLMKKIVNMYPLLPNRPVHWPDTGHYHQNKENITNSIFTTILW